MNPPGLGMLHCRTSLVSSHLTMHETTEIKCKITSTDKFLSTIRVNNPFASICHEICQPTLSSRHHVGLKNPSLQGCFSNLIRHLSCASSHLKRFRSGGVILRERDEDDGGAMRILDGFAHNPTRWSMFPLDREGLVGRQLIP